LIYSVGCDAKAATVVIDDTAVTPRNVFGFSADRGSPIVGRIVAGSLRTSSSSYSLVLWRLAIFFQMLTPLTLGETGEMEAATTLPEHVPNAVAYLMIIVHAIVKPAAASDGSATATVQRTLLEPSDPQIARSGST
jgi:Protein of unknown function (DUF808)